MKYTPVRQRKEERASSPPMIFDLCEAKYDKMNKIDSKMTHSKNAFFANFKRQ